MNRRTMTLGVALFLGAIVLGASPLANFVVVVHAKNPTRTLGREELARFFVKKEVRWPDGSRVEPVDRDPESAVRREFSQAVHGKEVAAIKSFWQRQLFSGRDTPPPELASDRAVLEYVAAHPGAIGYVSADSGLGEGVHGVVLE